MPATKAFTAARRSRDAASRAKFPRVYRACALSAATAHEAEARAGRIGADAARVRKAIADHAHKKTLDDDQDVSDDFAVSGTPHFFVDGRRLVGAQPPESFEKIIDDEIPKAQELVKKGTRPGALYEALTRDGKGPPEPATANLPKGLPPNDPARGNADAKVVIHEFADFQCP